METFTVTGSYIPTNETAFTAGVSPVIRIDQKVIDESGLSNVTELLQRVTVSNGGAVPISNNGTGFTPAATSASLRGLGPEATLVLLNGRRVAPYPIGNSGTTAFVDLNTIPLSSVDTIEVLKDGASAIYGADAVAGVINIKMRRGFDDSAVGREHWDALVAQGDAPFISQTWLCQSGWWQQAYRDKRLLLIAAERAGEVVALAPLYADEGVVYFVGTGAADYLDFVGDVNVDANLDLVAVR